jgi:hypothetical protein
LQANTLDMPIFCRHNQMLGPMHTDRRSHSRSFFVVKLSQFSIAAAFVSAGVSRGTAWFAWVGIAALAVIAVAAFIGWRASQSMANADLTSHDQRVILRFQIVFAALCLIPSLGLAVSRNTPAAWLVFVGVASVVVPQVIALVRRQRPNHAMERTADRPASIL